MSNDTEAAAIRARVEWLEFLSAANQRSGCYDTGFGLIQTSEARKRQAEIDELLAFGKQKLRDLQGK